MALVALVFILSQLVAASTSDVSQLWITSSLCVTALALFAAPFSTLTKVLLLARCSLGLGYGGLFGLAPIIALELFGMDNWSMKCMRRKSALQSDRKELTTCFA